MLSNQRQKAGRYRCKKSWGKTIIRIYCVKSIFSKKKIKREIVSVRYVLGADISFKDTL